MVAAGRGKNGFLQWSETGYVSHVSGQATCSRIVNQHKAVSLGDICVLVWCWFFLFVCGVGYVGQKGYRSSCGRGKKMTEIHYMKKN